MNKAWRRLDKKLYDLMCNDPCASATEQFNKYKNGMSGNSKYQYNVANSHHCGNDILTLVFLYTRYCILIKIVKLVPWYRMKRQHWKRLWLGEATYDYLRDDDITYWCLCASPGLDVWKKTHMRFYNLMLYFYRYSSYIKSHRSWLLC